MEAIPRIIKMIITILMTAAMMIACSSTTEDSLVQSPPAEQPTSDGDSYSSPETAEAVGAIGSRVLDFSLRTYDGGTFTTADLFGKVTLLVFWFPT